MKKWFPRFARNDNNTISEVYYSKLLIIMPKKVKKPCPITVAGVKVIDYKDTIFLKQYLTKFNRIIPRYYSWVSLANQKKLAAAIKRARYMALLPYVLEVTRPSGVSLTQNTAPVASDAVVLDESAVAL